MKTNRNTARTREVRRTICALAGALLWLGGILNGATQPAVFGFTSNSFATLENSRAATITVEMAWGDPFNVYTIDYATHDGTATAGLDYVAQRGTLSFEWPQTVKSFTIPIISDRLLEDDEAVLLTLSNPAWDGMLGTIPEAVLTIGNACFVPPVTPIATVTTPAAVPVRDFRVSVVADGSSVELRWPARLRLTNQTAVFPVFVVQRSADLQHWESFGEPIKGNGEASQFVIAADSPHAFFRVLANVQPTAAGPTGMGGAEVFGYEARFAAELQRVGQILPEEFGRRHAVTNEYLPRLSWDPTAAQFWNSFNLDPAVHNETNRTDPRRWDFRLNDAELNVLTNFGFVVSERLGTTTFAESFYRIWGDDLPVFVSTDAILQTWHRTYDAMLQELEETYLSTLLGELLDGMAAGVPEAWRQYGQGPLGDSIRDADYFLAVARSLLRATPAATHLNQDDRVAETLAAVARQQLECIHLFGRPRLVDFSQFKVRGHYEDSILLSNYFRATMWVGRTDFRVAGEETDCDGFPMPPSTRDLGTALVLTHLLQQAGQLGNWLQFDRILQVFVGWTDSLTFAQMADLLDAAGIRTPADVPDLPALERLQSAIAQGQLGAQSIRSDYFFSPLGADHAQLPRSFTVFGQKFVVDSWALAKVVFDEILWDSDGVLSLEDKVQRRMPSCLDIAFSVLGNNQIVPELVARITDQTAWASDDHLIHFRDGRLYQHNLAAVRQVIDSQRAEAWDSNIYVNWLAALRELSAPTTAACYPETMRTRPWAMKTLNTQLASWTQLRHDTILYAKQSYTSGGGQCAYPAAYVEPRVAFWRRLKTLASNAADLIGGIAFPPEHAAIQVNQYCHLDTFAQRVATLESISEKELSQEPLSFEETQFLQDLIQYQRPGGCGGARSFNGWYPKLFYRKVAAETFFDQNSGADKWDAIVADVHTDVPTFGPPWEADAGAILHQGIGNVHLLLIAIDAGTNRTIFAGPVLSHYEFETPFPIRKADSEWKQDWSQAGYDAQGGEGQGDWSSLPRQPDWTRSYLVPHPNRSANPP